MGVLFHEYEVSLWEHEKILEMDNGGECTAIGMQVKPLNCTLKNGLNDKFYFMYILPSLKKLSAEVFGGI